ncbi:MAG: phospho-N-acetylmuramoyl-pentapeptide-transferase [Actinomycetota bacterium]
MYQIIIAGVVSLALILLLGPFWIRFVIREGIGQQIREEGPERHLAKSGTPTMGGVLVLGAATFAFFAAGLFGASLTTASLVVLFTMLLCGAVGFLDDFIKNHKARSQGLTVKWKIILLFFVSLFLTWGAVRYALPKASIVGIPQIGLTLDIGVFYFLFVFVVLLATTTAVNFTDGLDGLAAGNVSIVVGVYSVICFMQFRHLHIPYGLDLAVFSAAVIGAAAGFMWFNTHPADIFMGDTGSLGLGGAIAALAIFTKTEILLILIGGVLVIEVLSVIAQVLSYKLFKKRVLKMAPLHHHFELSGWSEFKVVVRFWLMAAILAAAGFTIFFVEILKL